MLKQQREGGRGESAVSARGLETQQKRDPRRTGKTANPARADATARSVQEAGLGTEGVMRSSGRRTSSSRNATQPGHHQNQTPLADLAREPGDLLCSSQNAPFLAGSSSRLIPTPPDADLCLAATSGLTVVRKRSAIETTI